MQANFDDTSPRIAKITSTAQQFRELINSLRNNQRAKRPQTTQISQNVQPTAQNTQIPKQFPKNQQISHPVRTAISKEQREEECGLKTVPKIEVGGRDQLKKINSYFDEKKEIPNIIQPKPDKKEVSIQIGDQSRKDINLFSESPRKNVQIQCQLEPTSNSLPIQSSSFLTHPSKINQRAGQIVKQNFQKEELVQSVVNNLKKIKDIPEKIVVEYCRKEKIVEKSEPSEIFSFFANLCLSCDVIVKCPTIKKFKNCIYYGFPIKRDELYEGFLYFYDEKVYFGQFLNGLKHGLGVQLDLKEQIKFKGQFSDGRKTGKFYVEKQNQRYIGYLENGLYQGEGRLTTSDYIYEGLFQKGQKNGYGQQFYPKTGVKIFGIFKNGILSKTKTSRSIPQLANREKLSLGKQKDKEKLQIVKKKSLEKHNNRMNKVRSFKDSEYQIQFDTQADYCEHPKINFNATKLQVYRQPLPKLSTAKLPKLYQEVEYSFEDPRNFDSLTSRQAVKAVQRKPRFRDNSRHFLNQNPERQATNECEDPLPTPCLVYPRRER